MKPSERLWRNVSAEAGARVLYLATRFFIPPFVLARVGLEAYGLYGTVFVLVAYFGMSAIGFSNAYVKYAAEYAATAQHARANRLASSGFTLMSMAGVAGFAAFAFGWELLAGWMNVPAVLRPEARVLALLIVGSFFVYLALSVFRDVLTGLQEIAAIQRIWIASFLLETILIFLLVGAGFGLTGLGLAFLARTLLELVAHMRLARKRAPWLRVRPVYPDRESLRTLLGFGTVVQVNSLLSVLLNSVERLLATPLIGLSASGIFDLGKRFPSMATSIPSAFVSSVYPSAADLHARASSAEAARDGLRALYLSTSRSMHAVSGLLFSFLAFAAQPCLAFWLGAVPENAALLTSIFALSSQLHLLTGPGTSILKACGKPKAEFHYSLANCVALGIFLPLARLWTGGWTVIGIGVACVAATSVAALWFLRQAHRRFGLGLREYFLTTLLPGLIPYAAGGLTLAPLTESAVQTHRLGTGISLALLGLLYCAVSAAMFWFVCASRQERQWARNYGLAALQRTFSSRSESSAASRATDSQSPALAASSMRAPASVTMAKP